MLIRNEIKQIVQKSLKKEGFEEIDFQVSKSKDRKHGDYSLSIALEIGKKQKANPIEVANKLTVR